MQICVKVFLKNGVLDPQAKAIENALHALNFSKVKGVKIAKEILIDIDTPSVDEAKNLARQMCDELLVNSVIEEYELI